MLLIEDELKANDCESPGVFRPSDMYCYKNMSWLKKVYRLASGSGLPPTFRFGYRLDQALAGFPLITRNNGCTISYSSTLH
jgi:hypothetical protein